MKTVKREDFVRFAKHRLAVSGSLGLSQSAFEFRFGLCDVADGDAEKLVATGQYQLVSVADPGPVKTEGADPKGSPDPKTDEKGADNSKTEPVNPVNSVKTEGTETRPIRQRRQHPES